MRLRGLDVAHDGKSGLPCSLVMTFGLGRPVIAHAQLLPVMGKPESAYLHDGECTSLEFLRGIAIGGQLMTNIGLYSDGL